METKYTPGPWSACLDSDGRHHELAILSEAMEFQGETWPYHPKIAGVYHGGGSAPRAMAVSNARLIAAAPDLLEALQKCDLAFACWQIGAVPGRPEDILALTAQVRAAITKATGA